MFDVLTARAGVEVSLDADRETGKFFDSKAYVLQKLVAEIDELYMRNVAKAILFFELKRDAELQKTYRQNSLPELPYVKIESELNEEGVLFLFVFLTKTHFSYS